MRIKRWTLVGISATTDNGISAEFEKTDEGAYCMASDAHKLEKRIAELEGLLRYRDGGTHDPDCKINYDTGACTCGHDAVSKSLEVSEDE